MVGALPTGTRGIDCDTTITADAARRFYARGYRFVMRYVRRAPFHPTDLTVGELAVLLRIGLAVGVVQHVAPPGWRPTAALGHVYGETAALETDGAGVSPGTTVWCDLEGVAADVPHADVIAYCNAWHAPVRDAGFAPGLYVGDACGLTADELYRRLRFDRYWAAYNLNRDQYPAVRGAQLRQHAATSADHVPGVGYEFDVNLIGVDALGGTPTFMLARGDR